MAAELDALGEWLQRFGVPAAAIAHQRLYKTDLARHGGLTKPAQRQLDKAELIELRALIKPAHVQAPAVQNPQAEYLEIAVLHAVLSKAMPKPSAAQALQKAVSYPALVILSHGDQWRLHLAEKRPPHAQDRKSAPDKLLIEYEYDSGWLDAPGSPSAPAFWELAFWDAFALPHCRRSNLQVLYRDLCARVLALNCAAVTGDFRLSDPALGESLPARRQRLARARELERELRTARAKIRKEADFAAKLALNQRISQLRQQHAALQKQL